MIIRRPWRDVTTPGAQIHIGSKVYTLLVAETVRPFTGRKVRAPDGREIVSRVNLNDLVDVEADLGSTSPYVEQAGDLGLEPGELAGAVVAAVLGGTPFVVVTADGRKVAPAEMLPGALRAHLILLHGRPEHTVEPDSPQDFEALHAELHAAGIASVAHIHERI